MSYAVFNMCFYFEADCKSVITFRTHSQCPRMYSQETRMVQYAQKKLLRHVWLCGKQPSSQNKHHRVTWYPQRQACPERKRDVKRVVRRGVRRMVRKMKKPLLEKIRRWLFLMSVLKNKHPFKVKKENCFHSIFSSLSWILSKPPFDIIRTISPDLASSARKSRTDSVSGK